MIESAKKLYVGTMPRVWLGEDEEAHAPIGWQELGVSGARMWIPAQGLTDVTVPAGHYAEMVCHGAYDDKGHVVRFRAGTKITLKEVKNITTRVSVVIDGADE
jgi:hypothetical protein